MLNSWNDEINKKNLQIKNPKNRLPRSLHNSQKLIVGNLSYLNFMSNDYLGLSINSILKDALIQGIERFGVGSTGAPSLSGYTEIQQQLENQMAKWLNFEKCLVFNSGYHIGVGIFNKLIDSDTQIWLDKNCHASHIDGILLARMKFTTFKAENILKVMDIISQKPQIKHLILTEGTFSMNGICSYLELLLDFKRHKPNILLVIDDAHGVGSMGDNGFGTLEKLGLNYKLVDLFIGTFAKSFGGYGGFICGNLNLVNYLQETVTSQIYSSCLPPAIYAANLAALKIIQSRLGYELRQNLVSKIEYFIKLCLEYDLPLYKNNLSPIQLFIFKENFEVIQIYEGLLNLQIIVGKILYPTVSKDKPRLRISLNVNLTMSDIKLLCDSIKGILICKNPT